MPDIPFSLLWGSWSSGNDLFLHSLPEKFVNRHSCSMSCKTKFGNLPSGSKGKASVDKWYPECLCQAGWHRERLWNLWILSAHSYSSTQQVSVLAVDPIHFPEHAKWTSLSWWGFPMVLLYVGTHLLYATLEIILKASFFCQIWFLFSLFGSFSKFAWNFPSLIPFPPISSFNNMSKEELNCIWGCRTFLGFLNWEVSGWWGLMAACLYQMCHLLLWWDWQVERESRRGLEKLVVWIRSARDLVGEVLHRFACTEKAAGCFWCLGCQINELRLVWITHLL